MATKLNLLPEGYGTVGKIDKILKIVKSLSVIFLAVLIFLTLGMSIFFAVSNVSLNNLVEENESLKKQIRAQQSVESRLVLLKDRLAKIKVVQNSPSSIKNLSLVDSLLSNLGGNSSLTELNVDPQKIEASINFRSNADLSAFLINLSNSNNFAGVTLSSFSYNQDTGYLLGFKFLGK